MNKYILNIRLSSGFLKNYYLKLGNMMMNFKPTMSWSEDGTNLQGVNQTSVSTSRLSEEIQEMTTYMYNNNVKGRVD